jgi:beta-lactamase superfamily II metal-dependent hydrolase
LYFFSLAVLLLAPQSRAGGSTVNATFINVGQGDSILLREGNGFDMLIDGGDTDAGPALAGFTC